MQPANPSRLCLINTATLQEVSRGNERPYRVDRGGRPNDHARVRANGFPEGYQVGGERHGETDGSFGVQIGDTPVSSVSLATEQGAQEEGGRDRHGAGTGQLCIAYGGPSETVKFGPGDSVRADSGGIEGVESRAISVSDRSTFKDLEQKRPRVGTSPALRFANRKTGSGAFRDLAIEAYPALADPAYMRLFIALLDPLHRSEDGTEVVIAGQTLAACMAREIDYATCRLRRTYDEGGNITADETTAAFLEAFDRDVFDGALPWTDFTAPVKAQAGKARAVPVDGLRNVVDAAVWDAWQTDRATDPNDMKDRVYLDNGTPFGSGGRSRERRRVLTILEHVRRGASCELSARLTALLNGQPSHYFEGLRERLPAAREAVERLDTTERGKAHQRGVLENVDDQPQPYYGASDHSVRVFNIVPHLPSLSAPVRRTLLADSVEYDLAASQLAIVARDWGLPTLYDFLDAGNSPWALILDTMGLPYTPAARRPSSVGRTGSSTARANPASSPTCRPNTRK